MVRIVRSVSRFVLPGFLRRLGGTGACDNAYRACEEHRLALLRIDAIGRRLAPGSAARQPKPRARPARRPA
jgi:hypothetical protein